MTLESYIFECWILGRGKEEKGNTLLFTLD